MKKNSKIKMIFSFVLSTLLFPIVNALQQSGGPLIAYTPLGGSNETKWGIGNNDNVTISLKMRAEGEVANYVSFPTSVEIEPGKFVYIPIQTSLPKNESLLGKSIAGSMYALLEGKSGGQVVINLQAKKSITIIPYEGEVKEKTNPMTGFFALPAIGSSLGIMVFAAVVLIGVVIYLFKFKEVKI